MLNYKIQGRGKPMLLLHGLFGSLSNLGVLARAFESNFQCILIDLPNHGLSAQSKKTDYQFQAAQIKKLVDKLQLKQITLVGHSMGGKVAMAFALLYPTLVEKLVVLDISPVNYEYDRHENVLQGLMAVVAAKVQSRQEADNILATHIKESSVRQFLLSALYKNESLDCMAWRFNLTTIENQYQDIAGWPSFSTSFFGDCLFIKGQTSDYILPTHQSAIVAFFPNASASVVANTGHWLHSEKPESVIRFIRQFLVKNAKRR